MSVRTTMAAAALAATAAVTVGAGVANAAGPAQIAAPAPAVTCQWEIVGAQLVGLWAETCADRSFGGVGGWVEVWNGTGAGIWVKTTAHTTIGPWSTESAWTWLNPGDTSPTHSAPYRLDPTPATSDRVEARVTYNTAAIGTWFDHVYSPWI